jgi:FAD-dependent urate hydroxylase
VRLGELIASFADPASTLLGALDVNAEIHVSAIEEVALESGARERVVLVGDAAHPTSPNMAQGVAMALDDALVPTARCSSGRDGLTAASPVSSYGP